MLITNIQPLAPTGDRTDFLVEVLGDSDARGTFIVEFTYSVQTSQWLGWRDLMDVAALVANAFCSAATEIEDLNMHRFRMGTFNAGKSFNEAIQSIQLLGIHNFSSPQV
jgi:hypothetical protein